MALGTLGSGLERDLLLLGVGGGAMVCVLLWLRWFGCARVVRGGVTVVGTLGSAALCQASLFACVFGAGGVSWCFASEWTERLVLVGLVDVGEDAFVVSPFVCAEKNFDNFLIAFSCSSPMLVKGVSGPVWRSACARSAAAVAARSNGESFGMGCRWGKNSTVRHVRTALVLGMKTVWQR